MITKTIHLHIQIPKLKLHFFFEDLAPIIAWFDEKEGWKRQHLFDVEKNRWLSSNFLNFKNKSKSISLHSIRTPNNEGSFC